MPTNVSPNSSRAADHFSIFPEFSKLALDDRRKYEKLTVTCPPIGDTRFYSLMIHWNARDVNSVSELNGNLIVSYWMPGVEKYSGLSLIGNRNVDETLCIIFDHLKSRSEMPRLVHVPEFVVENIQFPEMYRFKAERGFDEYVISLEKLCDLEHMVSFRRRKIKRFQIATKGKEVVIEELSLKSSTNKRLLVEKAVAWKGKGLLNNLARHINETIGFAISNADKLALHALCLFVDGELHGYILYHQPSDDRYIILTHAVVNTDIPYTYDYLVYDFANWFVGQGTVLANIDSDLNIPLLRMIKMALRPVNYFRKYTIEPVK